MSTLQADSLSKSFDGFQALKSVSLSVASGERRAIIGPNGAGKTTLFNLITGDLAPDAGSVRLFGQELVKIPTQQREHDIVLQGLARKQGQDLVGARKAEMYPLLGRGLHELPAE